MVVGCPMHYSRLVGMGVLRVPFHEDCITADVFLASSSGRQM